MKSLNASPIILIAALLLKFISCDKDKDDDNEVVGCTNEYATNYDANATIQCYGCCEFKQGDVVFWADSSSFVRQCEPNYSIILVNTKTGKLSGGINYFPHSIPANFYSTQQAYIRM